MRIVKVERVGGRVFIFEGPDKPCLDLEFSSPVVSRRLRKGEKVAYFEVKKLGNELHLGERVPKPEGW